MIITLTKPIAFAYGLVSRHLHLSCFYFPCKVKAVNLLFRTGNVKLLKIGLIPIIPSVAAQNQVTEVKNNDNSSENKNGGGNVDSNNEDNAAWERLKAVFVKDEFGRPSKEIVATSQATCLASIVGAIIGGIISSRQALHDFVERNQATMYESTIDAKRRLQNHVTIHFGKGAFRWAWRLSLFTGGFMMFLTSLSAYRGKTNVLDYVLSGAVVGGLLRVKLGPPAIVIGFLTGGVLGLFCGGGTQGLLYLYGTDLDEVLSFQYEIDRRREELYKLAEKHNFEETQLSPEDLRTLKEQGVIKET